MGNHLVFEHTVRDLVSLTSNVLAIALDFKLQKSLGGCLGDQSGQGVRIPRKLDTQSTANWTVGA